MFDSFHHPALKTYDNTADTLSDAFFKDPDMWNAQAFSKGRGNAMNQSILILMFLYHIFF